MPFRHRNAVIPAPVASCCRGVHLVSPLRIWDKLRRTFLPDGTNINAGPYGQERTPAVAGATLRSPTQFAAVAETLHGRRFAEGGPARTATGSKSARVRFGLARRTSSNWKDHSLPGQDPGIAASGSDSNRALPADRTAGGRTTRGNVSRFHRPRTKAVCRQTAFRRRTAFHRSPGKVGYADRVPQRSGAAGNCCTVSM